MKHDLMSHVGKGTFLAKWAVPRAVADGSGGTINRSCPDCSFGGTGFSSLDDRRGRTLHFSSSPNRLTTSNRVAKTNSKELRPWREDVWSSIARTRLAFSCPSLRGKVWGPHACGATPSYTLSPPFALLTRLFSKTRLERKDFQEMVLQVGRRRSPVQIRAPRPKLHCPSSPAVYEHTHLILLNSGGDRRRVRERRDRGGSSRFGRHLRALSPASSARPPVDAVLSHS